MTPIKYIGFTTQYYTLWEVTQDGRYFYYRYVQNLSKDLDKAKEKQPTAIVDLSLKGHHSFKTEYIPTDCFQFGKHRGERFAEVEDITYLVWYHNACKGNDNMQKNPRKILLAEGYKIWKDKLAVTEDTFNELSRLEPHFPKFQTKVDNNEPFRFNCSKNVLKKVDEEGNLYGEMNIPFCKLIFNEICQQEYKDIIYYLPTINNIPTRVKGSVVTIDEYNATLLDADMMIFKIEVLKFHIN